MDGVIYLDYNATTPLEPEVVESIQDALKSAWGNPSSSHHAGKSAKALIDQARENVARMLGAKSSDIVFTSGGTEADNMILQTAVEYFHKVCTKSRTPSRDHAKPLPHIISSHMEHPAVNVMLQHLQDTSQAEISYVPLCKVTGRLEVKDVLAAIRSNTIMVTVMLANNETGIIQPVKEINDAIKALTRHPGETERIFVHTDAAQAIGKIPVDVHELGVDYLTVVGHKVRLVFARLLYLTENTGMIAGLGKACELVTKNLAMYQQQMEECRDYLETKLHETFPGQLHFNGKLPGSTRLPNTCNVSILGDKLQGHNVLARCQRLQASVGAACHAQNRPSSILLATGIPESIARNALRLSLGRSTTKADVDIVIEDLHQAVLALNNS
ncbi:selenocysteine lyase-like [Ruditapes philippinarum]|uniref:selenocysteine lyase-like n=1 Tax=Ruditapes philippinarum TaxID=129788 RepID=UPI00295C2641|nr:selenocysteine lyase-like [Ruditapes philippinarum]